MPHLILEHSDNLVEPLDTRAVCAELHAALLRFETFTLEDMKSRIVARDRYYSGAGAPEDVFAHLTVYIMAGRPPERRKEIGAALLAVVKRGLGRSWRERRCDVTVDVREMDRGTYAKEVSGG